MNLIATLFGFKPGPRQDTPPPWMPEPSILGLLLEAAKAKPKGEK